MGVVVHAVVRRGTVALRIPFTPPILSALVYPFQHARLFASV